MDLKNSSTFVKFDLYQSMLLLNSNNEMRHFIVNHTKLYGEPGRTTNTTVAEWKAAVKKSFGLNYYNDMTLEILEQYATFYWVYELQEQYMYGSSRLGSVQRNLPLVQQVLNSDSLLYYSYSNDCIRYMERGQKRYELSNHLGNVLAVVSDRKLVHCSNDELMWFEAQVVSVTDYYPFGMEIRERSWSVSAYRYGFNGMEQSRWLSGEVSGSGNSYTAEFWQYDSRLGRRWNVDPVVKIHESPYAAFANNPIWFVDPSGADTAHTDSKSVEGLDRYIQPTMEVEKTGLAKVFSKILGRSTTKTVDNPEYNEELAFIVSDAANRPGISLTFTTIRPDGIPANAEGCFRMIDATNFLIYFDPNASIEQVGISPLVEELIHFDNRHEAGYCLGSDGNLTISNNDLLNEEARAKYRVVNLQNRYGGPLVKQTYTVFGLYSDVGENGLPRYFGGEVKTSYGAMIGMTQIQIRDFISTNRGATNQRIHTFQHFRHPGGHQVRLPNAGRIEERTFSQQGIYDFLVD
jgi:hypothetical protein